MPDKLKRTVTTELVESNRRNAKKSTGPINTKKTKLNAVKHGLYTKLENAGIMYGSRFDQKKAELREIYEIDSNDPLTGLLIASASFHLLKLEKAYHELGVDRESSRSLFSLGRDEGEYDKTWLVFRHEARAMEMLEKIVEIRGEGNEHE